jgi:hypothetical protein
MRTWALALVMVGCQPDTFTASDAATGDAVTGDASGLGDANVGDAATDVQGEAGCIGPFFCSTVSGAAYCYDFDGVSVISDNWNAGSPIETGGFSLGFGYGQFTSCPHSAEIGVPASTTPGSAWLLKDVALLMTGEVIVDIDIRLPSNPTGHAFSLVAVRSGQSGTPPSSGLIYNNGWQAIAGGFSAPIVMPNTPWVHCTLDVTFSSASGIETMMTIQGESAVAVADSSPLSGLGSFATVAVGIETTTTAPPGSLYYDNVVIQLK